MEIINSPYDPLTKDSLNTFMEKVRLNMNELYTLVATGTNLISTLTFDLIASENDTTISGELFTPKITKEPTFSIANIIEEDGTITPVSIITGCPKNGDYYDVVLAPSDGISNLKLSII